MANKMIYLSEECSEILKKKIKDNPDFNFSNFVQIILMQDNTNKISENRIKEKIKDLKIRLNDSQENITYWEGVLREHKSEEKITIKDLKEHAKRKEKLEIANEELKKALQEEIKKQNEHKR